MKDGKAQPTNRTGSTSVSQSENLLGSIEILASLAPEQLRDLEKRCRWRRYDPNDQILDQDDQNRDVYFVVSGEVRIVNYSLTGREVALARVGAGGFFGELSAIDERPRSASAVALSKCQLASLSPLAFNDLVMRHAEIAARVMRQLAAVVRSCDERIMDLSTLSAMQRVYMDLLRRCEEIMPNSGIWAVRKLPTQQTIANRASTSRETVARAMSQITSGGIVERKDRILYIRDRPRLEQLAQALEVEGDESTVR